MKKILVIVISLLLFFAFLGIYFNIETIGNYLTLFEYENSYKKSKDDVDLINLCAYLTENTSAHYLDEKRTKYLKELIDVISIESIERSEMSKLYNEMSVDVSPKEYAITLYIVHLLSSQEYELFVEEFSMYYLQVDYEASVVLEQSIQILYNRTNDPLIIKYAKKSYEKIMNDTDDEIIKKKCEVQIDVLDNQGTVSVKVHHI